MYRVAYLDHTARWSGGEVALYNLITNMDQTVEPLVVLAEEGPLADRLRERGHKVCILYLDEAVRNRNRNNLSPQVITSAIKMYRYGKEVGRLLREEKVVCVHTNSLKSAIYGAVAAKWAGIPLIWHIHDIIEAPYIRKIVAFIMRLLVKHLPDGVIANSKATMDTLNLQESRRKMKTVAYPSYFGKIGRQSQRAIKDEYDFTVLLVGRIADWKGQHVLLEAARSFSDLNVQFWIAGDALFNADEQYKNELLNYIEKYKLTNVTMLGHVNNITDLMSQADLLVHTSIVPEPFGQVIVEGMAVGLPVIASDAGGPKEIVVHEQTGLLIPPGESVPLVMAIQWMIDHPDARKEMGELAMKRVQELFLIEQTVETITSFYPQVISGRLKI
ncbi:glycosyltransferase family 4 protein [Paenibacillus sp. tmac-D7]|uniref:glycosyltransferase family 4 protein n=1 Tax=Paenibacillus sp. tmac-D7 TaxID=2591462 RepID=UPI0011421854|nr:glycosyltransferase family 4 protein [Paenibacillus sp. tmac-D7]